MTIELTVQYTADRAANYLADVLGDDMLAMQIGPHFTCGEVDKLAAALMLLNRREAAATLLSGHAEGEDEGEPDPEGGGDQHYHLKGAQQEDPVARALADILMDQYLDLLGE